MKLIDADALKEKLLSFGLKNDIAIRKTTLAKIIDEQPEVDIPPLYYDGRWEDEYE